jgi:hypothetical protein
VEIGASTVPRLPEAGATAGVAAARTRPEQRLVVASPDDGIRRISTQFADDVWYAGNIAFALWHERPSVLIDGDMSKSPWVHESNLACDGLVSIWQTPYERHMPLSRLHGARRQPDIELPCKTWNAAPVARFGWAIVPPKANCGIPVSDGNG